MYCVWGWDGKKDNEQLLEDGELLNSICGRRFDGDHPKQYLLQHLEKHASNFTRGRSDFQCVPLSHCVAFDPRRGTDSVTPAAAPSATSPATRSASSASRSRSTRSRT